MFPLYIDPRDGSKELMEYFHPDDYEECWHEYGDVVIIGNGPTGPLTVGIEVKSINDLVQSIDNGRFPGRQLPGLLEAYNRPYLLFYGDYRAGDGGALQVRISEAAKWRSFRLGTRLVPYGYLESFLFDTDTVGCRVKHVRSEDEAVTWLRACHRWWSKEWTDHKGLRRLDESRDVSLLPGLDDRTRRKVRVAKALPGIGFEKAMAASDRFRTIREMINATPKEWMEVDGIGKVLAGAIVNAVDQE